ncbi:MAG TPA: hypothetical protein ENH19_00160 [Actinobacteria bacterium]|nr:hypothetical protein [Actinomycetes bacterium]HEX21049.1 hypothetical protein [Actinomycetota bacterium]
MLNKLKLWQKLLIFIFFAWLILFIILLIITSLYNRNLRGLISIAGLILYGGAFLIFWRRRAQIIEKLKVKNTLLNFLITGWLAALLIEMLLYFTLSYQHQIGVILDIAYTAPTYLVLIYGWYILLKRYPVSSKEIFFLGGLNGLLIELPQKIFSGQDIIGIIVGSPLHVFIYGSLLLIPATLLGLTTRSSGTLIKKYFFALIIIPLIVLPANVLSIIILAIGQKL